MLCLKVRFINRSILKSSSFVFQSSIFINCRQRLGVAQPASPGIVDLDFSNSYDTNKVIIITKEEPLWLETLVQSNHHILVWMIILLFQILH
jgi:hypothetical protein